MAIADLGQVSVQSGITAGTTIVLTNTSAGGILPAGTTLHIVSTWDNIASVTAPTITASTVGGGTPIANHATPIGSGVTTTAGSGIWHQCWRVTTTAPIAASGGAVTTLTSNQSAVKRICHIEGWTGVDTTLRGTVATGVSTTGAPSVATTGTALVTGDLVIGSVSFENNAAMTGDADTLNGSWSTIISGATSGGAAATNVGDGIQYKIVTATGAQTYNPTNGVADSVACVYSLVPLPDPTVTQASYRFYADGTESASVALAAQDTTYAADVTGGDVNTLLRTRLQSTNTGLLPATDDYQLQWEKNASGTWTNVGGAPLVDSYAETNADATTAVFASTDIDGQSFLGTGKNLGRAGFWMRKFGAPTFNMTALLYAHTGTFGGGGTATGAPLATSTARAASTFQTTAQWEDFTFDGTVVLAAGTPYVIAVKAVTDGDGSNFAAFSYDNSASTHAGNASTFITSWVAQTYDQVFRVYEAGGLDYFNSSNLTEGAATTNRLGAGTGSFVAGKVSEDGLVDDLGWTANSYTEVLYALTLKQATLTNGDTLRFRMLRNGVTTGLTYTQTPTVTITKSPPAITQAAYRFYADGTESASGAMAAQNTTATVDTSGGSANLLLRTRLQSTNAAAIDATDDFALQWEKNASGMWSQVSAVENLTDSYNETNLDSFNNVLGGGSLDGQSFLGDGGKLNRAGFWMKANGSPSGSITARLYAHAGAYGPGGTGTGSVLATSTARSVNFFSGLAQWQDFTFDGTFTLVSGRPYVIVVTNNTVNTAGNCLAYGVDTTSPTHAGVSVFYNGTTWSTLGSDTIFRVYSAKDYGLVEGYDETNATTSELNLIDPTELSGQTFLGDGKALVMTSVWMRKIGAPPGSLTAYIYAHTGTFGAGGTGTGASPLATSTSRFASSLQITAWRWEDFLFDGTFTPVKGTAYVVVLGTDTATDVSNTVGINFDNTSPTHAGNNANRNSAGTWSASTTQDVLFRIYTSPNPLVPFDSANLTEGTATTNRLGAGTGSFVAGKVSEDAQVDDLGWSGNNFTEVLYAVTAKQAALVSSDTLRFRVLRNGVTTGLTYTAVPTATIGTPAITQAAYRFYADGTESASTAVVAQDTAYTADVYSGDVNTLLRMRLQSGTSTSVPDSDDFQLQLERNGNSLWVNVVASSPQLLDSYSAPGTGNDTLGFGSDASGQSFRGDGQRLLRADFTVRTVGSPPGNVTAQLYAHTNTFGVNGVGTGSPLATSTTSIVASSVPSTDTTQTFTFDGSFTLAAATPYVIVMVVDTLGDGSNYLAVHCDTAAPVAAGNHSVMSGGVWSYGTTDMVFAVYTSPVVLGYDSASLTEAAATTNRLTGGTGSFTAGKVSEDGLVDDLGWPGTNFTETLYALTLKQANLANSDTLRFRVQRNGGVPTQPTYTVTPTINVTKVAAATPTLVNSYKVEIAALNATSLVTPSFTPNVGEILVIKFANSDAQQTVNTPTISGFTTDTVNQRVNVGTALSGTRAAIFTCAVSTSAAGTVTIPVSGNRHHSCVVERWANAQLAATPATASALLDTTTPWTFTLTTVAANSIASYVIADWTAQATAGAAFTGTTAVPTQEQTATFGSGEYGAYWLYQTATTAGAQTVGMSAPAGMNTTAAAIEIQAAGGAVATQPVRNIHLPNPAIPASFLR